MVTNLMMIEILPLELRRRNVNNDATQPEGHIDPHIEETCRLVLLPSMSFRWT